ncbi:MAG: ribonuclease PH [Selenomonadaceae bacterium]|nr:ribonuclease PH [Selenomonadaceae bacterium]MBR3722108.1 ribonuclease PH [Selenomonadaceae bacterium]
MRYNRRPNDRLREIKMICGFQRHPDGSCLIEWGHTKVLCAATFEDRVPFFLKNTGEGWVTAEYSLLPSSTNTRTQREAKRGRQSGRTEEIQRLIGRALRSVIDTKALGERTLTVDCDVFEADGGTRVASITGAFVAVVLACEKIYEKGKVFPVRDFLAAVSVGISQKNEPILDLSYDEDSTAMVDMNIVMTGEGKFVEIQGTGEGRPFTRKEHDSLLELAEKGINEIIDLQKFALGNELSFRVGRVG